MALLLLACTTYADCYSTCDLWTDVCGATDGLDWAGTCKDECREAGSEASQEWAECWGEEDVSPENSHACVDAFFQCSASPCPNGPELEWPEGTSADWSCE